MDAYINLVNVFNCQCRLSHANSKLYVLSQGAFQPLFSMGTAESRAMCQPDIQGTKNHNFFHHTIPMIVMSFHISLIIYQNNKQYPEQVYEQ